MDDKKSSPIFSVIFKCGESYVGSNNYFNTGWVNIPKKPIKRIFYRLPLGDYLCLEDYEKYYHVVEATKDWMKIGGGKIEKLSNEPIIEYAHIMGKQGNKVTSYRITLYNKKFVIVQVSLGNKIVNYGLTTKCFVRETTLNNRKEEIKKDKWMSAKDLKVGHEILIYNYDKRGLEIFKVTKLNRRTETGKFHRGDITKRTFDVNDPKILKLNPNNWR